MKELFILRDLLSLLDLDFGLCIQELLKIFKQNIPCIKDIAYLRQNAYEKFVLAANVGYYIPGMQFDISKYVVENDFYTWKYIESDLPWSYFYFFNQIDRDNRIFNGVLAVAQDYMEVNEFINLLESNDIGAIFVNILLRKRKEVDASRSYIDAKTGAFNERALIEFFEYIKFKSTTFPYLDLGKRLFLGIVDFNYFRRINNLYGHAVGDIVLKKFVEYAKTSFDIYKNFDCHACFDVLVKNCLTDVSSLVFRIGGDEFVLILHGEPENIHKWCLNLSQCMQVDTNFNSIAPTFVIGIVKIGENYNLANLRLCADAVMYSLKFYGEYSRFLKTAPDFLKFLWREVYNFFCRILQSRPSMVKLIEKNIFESDDDILNFIHKNCL